MIVAIAVTGAIVVIVAVATVAVAAVTAIVVRVAAAIVVIAVRVAMAAMTTAAMSACRASSPRTDAQFIMRQRSPAAMRGFFVPPDRHQYAAGTFARQA